MLKNFLWIKYKTFSTSMTKNTKYDPWCTRKPLLWSFTFTWIVCFIKKPIETWEEDIDWWSKYYASIGELDKCKNYVELGYDKIQVLAITIHTYINPYPPIVRNCAHVAYDVTWTVTYKNKIYFLIFQLILMLVLKCVQLKIFYLCCMYD